MLHDVPAISQMLHDEFPEILIVVDAISAATTLPIHFCDLHIDALVLASQKAFMLPPGLSMVFCSDRYWERAQTVSPTSLYFDLKKERASQSKGNAAWTPPLHLILGLQHVLDLFQKEGWNNVYARHSVCSEYSHGQFQELGFTPVTEQHRPPGLSGAFPPESVDADVIRSELFKASGFRIAGGQDSWKGKVLRIGHMGVVSPEDLARCFEALKRVVR